MQRCLVTMMIALAGAAVSTTSAQANPVVASVPLVAAIHGHVESKLAALADRVDVRAPDVRVLTTEPVAAEHLKDTSSGFGWREDPIRHTRKFHGGDDYRGKRGVPILAAGDGVVILAQRQGGYGNVVYVDHGRGIITRYGHLQSIGVKKGETVVAGQPIGKLGSTGRTTGPHLHFEVRIEGSPVNPSRAMAVAELQREDPVSGRIAAFALSPELQAIAVSSFDPPKTKREKKSRPDRRGTVKRVRTVS